MNAEKPKPQRPVGRPRGAEVRAAFIEATIELALVNKHVFAIAVKERPSGAETDSVQNKRTGNTAECASNQTRISISFPAHANSQQMT